MGVMINWVQYTGSTLAMLAGYITVSPPEGTEGRSHLEKM